MIEQPWFVEEADLHPDELRDKYHSAPGRQHPMHPRAAWIQTLQTSLLTDDYWSWVQSVIYQQYQVYLAQTHREALVQDKVLTADQLKAKYGLEGGVHPSFSLQAWSTAVQHRQTRYGYWQWVAYQIHVALYHPTPDVEDIPDADE